MYYGFQKGRESDGRESNIVLCVGKGKKAKRDVVLRSILKFESDDG